MRECIQFYSGSRGIEYKRALRRYYHGTIQFGLHDGPCMEIASARDWHE